MSKVVNLRVVKQERAVSQEALWQRFVDAQEKSKATLRIEDGVAAGKAYAAFCQAFLRGGR